MPADPKLLTPERLAEIREARSEARSGPPQFKYEREIQELLDHISALESRLAEITADCSALDENLTAANTELRNIAAMVGDDWDSGYSPEAATKAVARWKSKLDKQWTDAESRLSAMLEIAEGMAHEEDCAGWIDKVPGMRRRVRCAPERYTGRRPLRRVYGSVLQLRRIAADRCRP